MSYTTQEKLKGLRTDIDLIEKEIIIISELAAEVSEKFQGLGNNIQNLSGIVGFFAGRKAGGATNLIGGAIGFFGDIYAGMKHDEALAKLAPKKLELSRAKSEGISKCRDILNAKNENLLQFFTIEANRNYEILKQDEFISLYGEDCNNSFYLYVMNIYLIQVCDYMLDQFRSWGWSNGKNDSTTAIKPDKTYILEHILKNIILADKTFIEAITLKTSTGGIYLMTQHESLFAVLLQKIINESTNEKKGIKKRVVNNNSFLALRKELNAIQNIENEEPAIWLKDCMVYQKAKSACKISSLNHHLFKYFFIASSITLLLPVTSILQNDLSYIFTQITHKIFIAFLVALFMSAVARFMLWIKGDEDAGNSIYYYFLYFMITLFTLGLMPIVLYGYKKKEDKYKGFVSELYGRINV